MEDSTKVSRKERFARLSHDCMAIQIWMNFLPEDGEMKLEDLKKMSTFDLTALYNEHAARQVKRMESRAKLEERTAQLLRDAGKLEEDATAESGVSSPAPQKGKKAAATQKPPIEAPPTKEEGTEEMATTKGKKAATKKAATKKTDAAPAGKRGAPLTDLTYTAIPEKSKLFNPGGNKLQASSARGVIFAAIQKKDAGIKRTKLEEQFPDQNVKSALDVLVKFGFIKGE